MPASNRGEAASAERRCANCDAPLTGDYCARCGQRRAEDLTVRGMFRHAADTLFDLDRGFLHTVKALFTRPGETCRAYVDGRRQPVTGPLKYCFILMTIYAVTANLLGVEVAVPGVEGFDEREQRLFYLLNSLLGYLIFFILIPSAALQRRLFRRSGDGLGATYAYALFTTGNAAWFSTVFALTGWLSSDWGLVTLLVLNVAYQAWAMAGFYGLGRRPPLIRAAVMMTVNFSLTNVVALAVGNLIVWLDLLEPLAEALA